MNTTGQRILQQLVLATRRAALAATTEKVPHGLIDFESAAVRQFMGKFGLLVSATPVHLKPQLLVDRVELMVEELDEFCDAADVQDMDGMADALVDLVYVVKGTAIQLGLPWEALMNDVHGANMRKGRGRTKRGQVHDVTKPEGWVGPQTATILKAAGYNRDEWFDEDGHVLESKLVGYPPGDNDAQM